MDMNLTMRQPKLSTVRDVATYLAVNKRTVYRLLKDRRLPAYRVGGQWRFKLEVIEDWMRRQGDLKHRLGGNHDVRHGAADLAGVGI
jgi:excisionase family DNA binding protein